MDRLPVMKFSSGRAESSAHWSLVENPITTFNRQPRPVKVLLNGFDAEFKFALLHGSSILFFETLEQAQKSLPNFGCRSSYSPRLSLGFADVARGNSAYKVYVEKPHLRLVTSLARRMKQAITSATT